MPLKTKRLTWDTETGRLVNRGQEESYPGRFVSQDCYWSETENDWVPMDERDDLPSMGTNDIHHDYFSC